MAGAASGLLVVCQQSERKAKAVSKFYRQAIRPDGTTTCPVCGQVNMHVTGKNCGHVAKVTAKHIVFYWWGCRPEGFKANKLERQNV